MENENKTAAEDIAEEQVTTAADGAERQESGADEASPLSDNPEDLTRLLEDARSKADEHWDQLLRARAELDNLKRRNERDLENAHKYALDNFVRELLQVWDSLELGHSAAQDEGADVEKLREGTELTLKLFSGVMAKFGVEPVEPQEGEAFNPDFHQAMSMQERADFDPNSVVTVVQKGYKLNERLVRPALVIVSKVPG
jgi:molecular chaperone GrpE